MNEHTTATVIPFPRGEAEEVGLDVNLAHQHLAVSKLHDALTPGFAAEFSPEEAEVAGAFREDALSEADAFDSALDAQT